MSSSVVENYQYDPEVDIVLYVCALAFRRSIADYESFGAWYNSPQALVRFHADAEDRPIFIQPPMQVFYIYIYSIIINMIVTIAMKRRKRISLGQSTTLGIQL